MSLFPSSLFPTQAFADYFSMWNELDPARVRQLLDSAVTEDVIFCDPANDHVGRDALAANAIALHAAKPDYEYQVISGFDHHHDRYRYAWRIVERGATVIEGMDVTTVDGNGKLARIDGFFGPLPELPGAAARS